MDEIDAKKGQEEIEETLRKTVGEFGTVVGWVSVVAFIPRTSETNSPMVMYFSAEGQPPYASLGLLETTRMWLASKSL